VKKFLLVILGVPLAFAVIATALGYEAPDDGGESKETTETPKPGAPSRLKVPLAVSGPDKTYEAKESATIRNEEDLNSDLRGVVTVKARESGVNACAPDEDTQSPVKWCRGGLNVHSFNAKVIFESGESEECYEDRDSFWGYEGEYESVTIPCLFELDLEKVASVELLGSIP